MTPERDHAWAEHICHPLPLVAVLVLAVNDHMLKGSGIAPAWLTGKLSDVAGLFFFPALFASLVRAARQVWRAGPPPDLPTLAIGAVVSTGMVFGVLKLDPAFNGWVAKVWGPNALDPTDLLALGALVPAWRWLRVPRRPPWRRLQVPAVVVAGLASVATSPASMRLGAAGGEAARWRVECAELRDPIVTLFPWDATVHLLLLRSGAACEVEFVRAGLRTSLRQGELRRVEASIGAGGSDHVTLSSWSAPKLSRLDPGEAEGVLVLDVRVNGHLERWEVQVLPGGARSSRSTGAETPSPRAAPSP